MLNLLACLFIQVRELDSIFHMALVSTRVIWHLCDFFEKRTLGNSSNKVQNKIEGQHNEIHMQRSWDCCRLERPFTFMPKEECLASVNRKTTISPDGISAKSSKRDRMFKTTQVEISSRTFSVESMNVLSNVLGFWRVFLRRRQSTTYDCGEIFTSCWPNHQKPKQSPLQSKPTCNTLGVKVYWGIHSW